MSRSRIGERDAAALRALLVTPDFPPSTGGIAVLMGRLVQSMPGVRTTVVTFGEDGARSFDLEEGLQTRRVADVRTRRPISAPVLNACAAHEAWRSCPDVIVSGHVVTSPGGMLARRLLGIPLVQYVHADEFRVRPRLTARALRAADATIAVSSYTRDLAVSAGADPARVHLIPPGVDPPIDSTGAGGGEEPILLTVASFLSSRKGHDVIVRALPEIRKAVPDVRWVAIGDGSLRPAIEEMTRDLGVDGAATFLGRVDDAERDSWLDRARLFCMPSRMPEAGTGGEGFGIVYLEAGAHGLPVIAGNVAGAVDAVVAGKTGLLVDPTDHEAVAAAAIELLTDRELARRLGEGGRRQASAHAWSRIGARVEALLRETAGACDG